MEESIFVQNNDLWKLQFSWLLSIWSQLLVCSWNSWNSLHSWSKLLLFLSLFHSIPSFVQSFQSNELPSPDFIAQYLSFLGLPKNVLDEIIAHAYQTAKKYEEIPWFRKSDPPSLGSVHSASPPLSPPIKDSQRTVTPNPFGPVQSNIQSSFCSSYHSNGGDWDVLRSAIDGVVDDTQIRNNFVKSFRLFSDSLPFKRD